MTLPIAENIPELDFNIGGLRGHSILCIFLREPELSDVERKIRAWLLHAVFSAARHYDKARELVVLQNNADQKRDGGLVLHLLDVSEHVEDCVTGVYRACMAVRRMADTNKACSSFIESHSEKIDKVVKMRNQFEHMHSQIVSGEVGTGPISIVLSDQGEIIKFRKLKLKVSSLHELLKGLFHVVASMYPRFDANSLKQAGGPMKLSTTVSVSDVEKHE